ncbi:3'-5' exonuclease [Halobacillus salinarum]|uniref:3'-5' exonuclease n=1 Tax=Halobacillus salinarum TaxID=2932257 RepID=A0ABY4EEN3_9BACI|nr:3'-5' exonuclease [Halobacillus salinarum]UOQ42574.1 3'-5' exonuclease [Halobacillus salinarum]
MLPTDLQILKYILFEKPMYYFKMKPYFRWHSYEQLTKELTSFNKRAVSSKVMHQKSLTELEYTIFDLETTGFIPEIGHEIISIGAIRIQGLESCSVRTFHQLVQPIRYVSRYTLKLTGLTRSQLENASPFFEVFLRFMEFSRGSVLVAHPAKFDMRFLQTMLKRWKLPAYSPFVLDSQKMAQWLMPDSRHQLDPLLRQFKIEKKERHHALNDAIMTAELFYNLLQLTLEREVSTLGSLNKKLNQLSKE